MFLAPPLRAGPRLPWDDNGFSARMLREHLDDRHDLASRRPATIDAHVRWLDGQVAATGRVLDLGCGPGLYTQRLAERGHECVGVDISPAAVAYARDQARTSDRACRYLLADLRSFQADDDFDLVLLLYGEVNTFETADVEKCLATIARCLAPGGVAVIEVSTERGVSRKSARLNSWYVANGGLFASGRHLVLSEAGWDDTAGAAVERWSIFDEDDRLTRYETTTWYLSDPTIEAMVSSAHLRVVDRFADLTGATFDPDADFQTLILAPEEPGLRSESLRRLS